MHKVTAIGSGEEINVVKRVAIHYFLLLLTVRLDRQVVERQPVPLHKSALCLMIRDHTDDVDG